MKKVHASTFVFLFILSLFLWTTVLTPVSNAGDDEYPMRNPETGKFYPSDYRYDPYDGTPLIKFVIRPLKKGAEKKVVETVAEPVKTLSEPEIKAKNIEKEFKPVPHPPEPENRAADREAKKGKAVLAVMVVTPFTSEYTFMREDLVVKVTGPVTLERIMTNVGAADSNTFEFHNLPKGEYTVQVNFGNKMSRSETVNYMGGPKDVSIYLN